MVTKEIREFNEFLLAALNKPSPRVVTSSERRVIGTPEEVRKNLAEVSTLFGYYVRKMSWVRLRLRIMKLKSARYLMCKLLRNGKMLWSIAFYHVVGRVPTSFEERMLMRLRRNVLKGRVIHSSATRVWIDKPGTTEKRGLTVPSYADRIIGKVILLCLSPVREKVFSPLSSGFRMSYDRIKAMIRIMNQLSPDSKLISADVRKCFDRINHRQLRAIIHKWKLPKGYEKWAVSSLRAEIRDPEKGTVTRPTVGTPQGGILSPLLCNEALHQLDVRMQERTTAYDRYADNILYSADLHDEVEKHLASLGLELKEGSIEHFNSDRSLVHLGCELILNRTCKKLTVWFKRITPIYPPKATKEFMRIRAVLPKLNVNDPRRKLAGMSGYFSGNGNIILGSKLISPYNHTETWINPFDEGIDEKGERRYLTWCGVSNYSEPTWYASKTSWTDQNPETGKGRLLPLDFRIMDLVASDLRRHGSNTSLYKKIRGNVTSIDYLVDENQPIDISWKS